MDSVLRYEGCCGFSMEMWRLLWFQCGDVQAVVDSVWRCGGCCDSVWGCRGCCEFSIEIKRLWWIQYGDVVAVVDSV